MQDVKRYYKKRMRKHKVTEKMSRFIENYVAPTSPSQGKVYESAVRAGYGEKPALAMERDPMRYQFVSQAVRQRIEAQERLIDIPSIVDGILKETKTEYSRDRIRAWELLGKYKGMFTDKLEVSDKRKIIVLDAEQGISDNQPEEPLELLPEATGGTGEDQGV